MNYQKTYNLIIKRAISEQRRKKNGIYYESHHIIPISIGGNNKKENLVLLTAKEHYICHMLLVRIYKNTDTFTYIKMLSAFLQMKCINPFQQRDYNINSREFDRVKTILYGENGLKIGKNHQSYGKKRSDETRKIMSEKAKIISNTPEGKFRRSLLAKNKSKEEREFIHNKIRGQKRSVESKKRMSDAHIGKINEQNATSKLVFVKGKVYPSVREAFRSSAEPSFGLGTLYARINSPKHLDYYYIGNNDE